MHILFVILFIYPTFCFFFLFSPHDADADAPPRRNRRKQPTKYRQPASDDDPDPPGPDDREAADDTPDRFGWSRRASHVSRHAFDGPAPGPTFPAGHLTPVGYFFKFFPLMMLESMVTWTNINLVDDGKHRLTTEELSAYLGILMVMALNPINNFYDYWSERIGLRNSLIARTMCRQRFEAIQSHLACCRPADDPDTWPTYRR